jgi:predicted dithiol-disulfide oxidoreductase (DUF899 family)
MPATQTISFPGETATYREARDRLLQAEIELRRSIEEVAEQRRRLPLGGPVPMDYVFVQAGGGHPSIGTPRKMSELFRPGMDTLVLYSFMYGPEDSEACPMCTSMLDAMEGETKHVLQRTNFAVVAKSPPERIADFVRSRGWRDLPLLSSNRNGYNLDYKGEDEQGEQQSMLNVFVRRNGEVFHFFGSEIAFADIEEGQDSRHIDSIWPLWNLLDFTPEGRGTDWFPKLRYP